ncbi:MAG: hypothetical protein HYT97_09235 [Elusimicrobia bacterium]|nr:hypothetical protein [Elusimicrobiota bacterium]
MERHRKQKVVLRTKIRSARWRGLAHFFYRSFKSLAFISVLLGLIFTWHRISKLETFIIKSVEVKPQEGILSSKIFNQIAHLKGKSILNFSSRKIVRQIKDNVPQIQTVKFKRFFPDRVILEYHLRKPAAKVVLNLKEKNGQVRYVDEEGIFFSGEFLEKNSSAPEIELPNLNFLTPTLQFIKLWYKENGTEEFQIFLASLKKIRVNQWGEFTAELLEPSRTGHPAEIFWGIFEEKTFAEKMSALEAVWKDLRMKSMQAETVNLRGVPQETPVVLNQKEVVGRVIVRPREFTQTLQEKILLH